MSPSSEVKVLDPRSQFVERVRHSNQACQQGDFSLAIQLYSEALTFHPHNYILVGRYSPALNDAIKAGLINPKWPIGD
uniref:Tetratricopeptide repeat protein n=1 Tax=Gouania willdenowi TaxID=441366 RepID=A0A8C5GY86_GOUWI